MPVHRAEEGAAADASLFNPRLHIPHWACVGVGAVGDSYFPPLRLLIDIAPAERDREAILPESAIRKVQRCQLWSPERSCKPKEDQCPVPYANDSRVRGHRHRPDIIG
jgi:hypothetical protein